MKKNLFTTIAVLLSFVFPLLGQAEAYPDKPVTFICPYGAGGSTDIQARVLASALEKELGQPMIVKNVTGAGGLPGVQETIKSRPDGYTFGYFPLGPLVMQPHLRKIPAQIYEMEYVARIINAPYILFVSKDAPWQTFDEMMKDVLANPKKYRYASSGAGTQPHIALADLFSQYGADVPHVAFHSDADVMQSMAGGHVQISTAPMSVVRQYGVRPLMVFDTNRIPSLPDVPTSGEMGKEIIYTHWHVVAAPLGTPKNIIDAMAKAIDSLSTNPDYLARLEKLSMDPAYIGPDDTKEMVVNELEAYKDIFARVIK